MGLVKSKDIGYVLMKHYRREKTAGESLYGFYRGTPYELHSKEIAVPRVKSFEVIY